METLLLYELDDLLFDPTGALATLRAVLEARAVHPGATR